MTEEDVQELVQRIEDARGDWASGTSRSLFDVGHASIFGPFGGSLFDGSELVKAQAAVASTFREGTRELEVANTIICSDDVVCLALIERAMVRFEEASEPRPWILRSTMLFRREAGTWNLLHRHADPLIERRDLTATLGLLPHESS